MTARELGSLAGDAPGPEAVEQHAAAGRGHGRLVGAPQTDIRHGPRRSHATTGSVPGHRRPGWYGRPMRPLLDERRLREQAGARHPGLHRDIALGWIAELPAAGDRIRGASAGNLPAALHELRSGAVAVGLVALPAVLAAIEQGVEHGRPASPAELGDALALARRSAGALDRFWAGAAAPSSGASGA